MSDMELYNIPKHDLYWQKETIADQIFKLEIKLKTLKNPVKREQTKENIIMLCNDIKQIDSRMQSLYM
jgi:hypothetical protein